MTMYGNQTLSAASVAFGGLTPYLGKVFDVTGARTPYEHAGWQYSLPDTRFDNELGTWATDYFLAVVMLYGVVALGREKVPPARGASAGRAGGRAPAAASAPAAATLTLDRGNRVLALRAMALIGLYAISVFSGAVAHQHFTSIEMLNSRAFRALWSVCVGSVACAGGVIGAIGSALAALAADAGARGAGAGNALAIARPLRVPAAVWHGYGGGLCAIVLLGGFSMKRPAADIFLVGVTQAVPTAYVVLVLARADAMWPRALARAPHFVRDRSLLGSSLLLNAPLIGLYPLLLSLEWTLEQVNVTCHCWLLVAWGLQCVALLLLCRACRESASDAAAKKS